VTAGLIADERADDEEEEGAKLDDEEEDADEKIAAGRAEEPKWA
jgi:hypothetical protein